MRLHPSRRLGAGVLAEEDDADEDVGSVVGDGEKDKQA
jgi:hypothetical protein